MVERIKECSLLYERQGHSGKRGNSMAKGEKRSHSKIVGDEDTRP